MKNNKGLSGEAYDKFKEALLTRKIALGTTMTQSDLADILQVSVSPLRDALKVLESEGFVAILPRSGIKIAEPNIDLIKNTYQLRKIIEEPALLRYAEQVSNSELEEFRETHLDVLEKVKVASIETIPIFIEARELDVRFHERIVQALDNLIISNIYKTNQERGLLVRLRLNKTATPHYVNVTLREHLKILDALIEGDIEGARQALLNHLDKAVQRSMGF